MVENILFIVYSFFNGKWNSATRLPSIRPSAYSVIAGIVLGFNETLTFIRPSAYSIVARWGLSAFSGEVIG